MERSVGLLEMLVKSVLLETHIVNVPPPYLVSNVNIDIGLSDK